MELSTWLLYSLATLGLSVTPGPNTLLAVTHGALYGLRRTLFTITGGVLGFVVVMALSMFGIGALLQSSLVWLTVLKWLGGAYLVYLGVVVWRSPAMGLALPGAASAVRRAQLFRQGALSALTNPKAVLFFGAFLPQFIDPQRSLLLQFFIMTGTFVVLEFTTELVLAATAQRLQPWLARVGRRFNQTCGVLFVAIGVAMPLRA
jgi:homoserine/homoserine lactone efflux protein